MYAIMYVCMYVCMYVFFFLEVCTWLFGGFGAFGLFLPSDATSEALLLVVVPAVRRNLPQARPVLQLLALG